MTLHLHQPPRKALYQHIQHGYDGCTYGNTIIELHQELSHVSCQATRLRQAIYKVVAIKQEQLQLLLIGKRKGIAVAPEQEHQHAYHQRYKPRPLFIA